MVSPIPSAESPSIADLEKRLENISLEEFETMKVSLRKQPFVSATTTLHFSSSLFTASMPEEQIKYILYHMHASLQEYLETNLGANQLLFCYWYSFTIREKEVDPYLHLFQNLCRLASKILNEDLATQNFTPAAPATDWIEALQGKLGQTTTLNEAIKAFKETKPLLQAETTTRYTCPLQLWHTLCHLLTKAFPDIQNHRAEALTALLGMPSKESIIRASLGLTYLFQPPPAAPISYASWANTPDAHLFTVRQLLERPYCAKTESFVLGALGALLGEPVASPTFYQKIQDQYLDLFIQIAEGPSFYPALVVPLIERLLEPNDLYRSDVLAAINQALQHIVVNPCEFHLCARIYPKLFAFFEEIQREGNWQCYEEDLTPVVENLSDVKWDTKAVFCPTFPLIKREPFTSVSFQEIRRIITLFKTAKTTFPEETWPTNGLRHATKHYMSMLALAIKKLAQSKKGALQPVRLLQRVSAKNALVIELTNSLYSLRPPLKDVWVKNHLLSLDRSNITSSFDNELIFHRKADRLMIGPRALIKFLDPHLESELREKPKYPFPSPPNGSFVRRLCVKKTSPSPLSKTEIDD